jgi:hypothetical protein
LKQHKLSSSFAAAAAAAAADSLSLSLALTYQSYNIDLPLLCETRRVLDKREREISLCVLCVCVLSAAAATIFYMVRANDGQLLFLCLAQDFHIGRRRFF